MVLTSVCDIWFPPGTEVADHRSCSRSAVVAIRLQPLARLVRGADGGSPHQGPAQRQGSVSTAHDHPAPRAPSPHRTNAAGRTLDGQRTDQRVVIGRKNIARIYGGIDTHT